MATFLALDAGFYVRWLRRVGCTLWIAPDGYSHTGMMSKSAIEYRRDHSLVMWVNQRAGSVTVACYLDQRPEVAELMRLFAKGCGGKLVNRTIPDPEADDHAVVAKGIAGKLVPAFQKAKLPFWYIDSAYIQIPGRREYRIERGRFWPPEDMGTYSMDRAYEMGVRLQPWRKDGSHVLVCQPGPGAGRDFGIDSVEWAGGIRQRLLRRPSVRSGCGQKSCASPGRSPPISRTLGAS